MYVREASQSITRIIYVDETEPSSPVTGALWFNPSTKILKIYSNGWIEVDHPTLSGYLISQTPAANTIPLSDENGKLNIAWIPQGNEENMVLITQQPSAPPMWSKITGDLIQDETITSNKIAREAITTSHLSDNSVTEPKISNGAIILEKLHENLVHFIFSILFLMGD